MNIAVYINNFLNWITQNAIKLLIGIIILLIGFWIIKRVSNLLYKTLEKAKVEATLRHFLSALSSIFMKIILIIVVLNYVNIASASLAALLASIGFAIAFALKGTLANFAGGVIILLLKPYKIGDFILSSGISGVVEKIDIFYTHILTSDNKVIFVPNGKFSNTDITNYSVKPIRRLELIFSAPYSEDILSVKKVLSQVISKNGFILNDYAPFIGIDSESGGNINYSLKVWCNSSDYQTLKNQLLEDVRNEFKSSGINQS